ncbi:transcriptional regulator [Haemophilus parahaemolyticus]|uniref:transcriptional regulator n=1 Tax=Haemophilus parahaemolyticus TaxID=735 RepID=UPI0024906699|nr:YdaS family helix-turn-helix protein [Haemophilus parahaemolyticus]
MNKAVKKAIQKCGNQTSLARLVGVSQMTISNWLNGGSIRAEDVIPLSQATNGAISVEEICQSCLELSMQKGKRNGTQ